MTLPKPIFGNSYNQAKQTEVRRTLNNELKIAYDPLWPTIDTFKVSFRGLSGDLRDTLINFLQSSMGQVLSILDHENVQWEGFFIGEPEISDEGGTCKYTISMQFEGSRQ